MLTTIRRMGIARAILAARLMTLAVSLIGLILGSTVHRAWAEDAVASADPNQVAARGSAASTTDGENPTTATASDETQSTMEAEANSPVAKIESFHAGLIGIMKDAKTLGFQGRIDRLEPLMKSVFDLDFMASKTIGSYWRKMTDAEKKLWIEVFTRITVANYAGRFTGYTGEKFVTLAIEEAQRGQQMVKTEIVVPDDDDVELSYRLRKTDAGWRVIDVYLNGTVSELALRRSEYSSALKREGFEELVASIETKIKDMKAKGLVDG